MYSHHLESPVTFVNNVIEGQITFIFIILVDT